jgi:hypothetical protein
MTAAACALLAATALPAAATAKGGWATTTLDDAPQARAGETTDIGFTIRQHGERPVNVDDVAVVIRADDGDRTYPAVQEGPVGHYVAEVTFPDEGEYDWVVRQGWFGDYDMGRLRVGDADAAGGSGGSGGSWWSDMPWALRILLVLPIVASAGLYVLDRRRRTDQPDRPDEPVVAGA